MGIKPRSAPPVGALRSFKIEIHRRDTAIAPRSGPVHTIRAVWGHMINCAASYALLFTGAA